MSFRARQQKQRHHRRADLAPVRTPIAVNHYDPVTDVACSVVKVPYGKIHIGFEGSSLRSSEILETGGDKSVFIDPKEDKRFREERRAVRDAVKTWENDPNSVKTPAFPGQRSS